MSKPHRIAVIPGDGIGTEVVPEGLRVLDAAAAAFDLNLTYEQFDYASADYYTRHGRMLPDGWFEELNQFDSIFFGAVGWPDVVPDHVSLWGSLLQFRRHFDQYVSLRPVKLLPGVPSPLTGRVPGVPATSGQASRASTSTSYAPCTRNSLRGATSEPMSSSNTPAAASASSTVIRRRVRWRGSMVVSASCLASISPRPL